MEMINEGTRIARMEAQYMPAPALPGEYLTFRLGAEEYGIDIQKVQEIRSYEPPTRIPNVPACIKGVVNLRGAIVPVVDLRIKLDCAVVEYTGFTVVIVLSVHGRVIGAVVDSVSDVLNLDAGQIKEPPSLAGESGPEFITGIASVAERMLMLVNIDSLLGDASPGLAGEAG